MKRMLTIALAGMVLGGCGLGETAISTAAGGAAEVEQAKTALKTEQRVKDQVNAAVAVDAQHRAAAEADAQ